MSESASSTNSDSSSTSSGSESEREDSENGIDTNSDDDNDSTDAFEIEKERSRSRSPTIRPTHGFQRFEFNPLGDNGGCEGQNDRDKEKRMERSVIKDAEGSKDSGFEWVGPRRPSKSDVWKKWGFKRFPIKKIDYSKVYCKLCDVSQNYGGTASNMKFHLFSKHAVDINSNDPTQPKAFQYFKSKEMKMIKYPRKHPVNIKSREVLVKWICKRNRPYGIVDDPELSEFCELLNPQYNLPSRGTIVNDIEKTYKSEKEKLVEKLKLVSDVYGTNDGGSALNGESFLSYTIHYVEPETWELKNVTLGCSVMKEVHTAGNYRAKVDKVEENFQIKGKVVGYTTDNEAKMHKAFENDLRNGCIAHIQSKTMQKAVEHVNCIAKVRKKLRRIAKIAKFSRFKYALEKSQVLKKLPKRKVLQEVKTRFTSTLTMFHSVMSYDKDADTDDTSKKAKLNINAINDALDDVATKKSRNLKIKASEANIIIATSEVLEPVCDMLTMLGGENYVTGGIVLPYMKKIVMLTKVKNTDPKFVVDLKKFINKDFLQRCRDNINFDLCKKATFLDVRFKSLKCIEESQRVDLKQEMIEEMKTVELEEKEQPHQLPHSREPKKLTLESESEDDEMTASESSGVMKELENYIKEPKLPESSDPLRDFWKLKNSHYPRLAVLARRYLIVQATSTPSERVFSKMGNTVSKKRGNLTANHTDQTIFLSSVL